MGNVFTQTGCAICGSRERERRRVCAVRICLSSKKRPDLDAQDALLSEPPVREAFLGMLTVPTLTDTLCAAYVCMLPASPRPCPPCMLTSSHFLSRYNNSHVSGDSQPLDGLSLKIGMDQTNTFAKEGLPGRAFFYRPMFGRTRRHYARADDSAGLPRLSVVLFAVTACFAEFKHHVGSVSLPSWF